MSRVFTIYIMGKVRCLKPQILLWILILIITIQGVMEEESPALPRLTKHYVECTKVMLQIKTARRVRKEKRKGKKTYKWCLILKLQILHNKWRIGNRVKPLQNSQIHKSMLGKLAIAKAFSNKWEKIITTDKKYLLLHMACSKTHTRIQTLLQNLSNQSAILLPPQICNIKE